MHPLCRYLSWALDTNLEEREKVNLNCINMLCVLALYSYVFSPTRILYIMYLKAFWGMSEHQFVFPVTLGITMCADWIVLIIGLAQILASDMVKNTVISRFWKWCLSRWSTVVGIWFMILPLVYCCLSKVTFIIHRYAGIYYSHQKASSTIGYIPYLVYYWLLFYGIDICP